MNDDLLTPRMMIDHLRGFDDPQERHEAVLSTLFADALVHICNTNCGLDSLIQGLGLVNSQLRNELSEKEIYRTAAEAFRQHYADHGKPHVLSSQKTHLQKLVRDMATWDDKQIFRFGVDQLDESFGGLLPGETLSLVGAQGSMKTALALTGAETYLRTVGGRILFLSLDMPPQKVVIRRLMREMDCNEPTVLHHIRENTQEFREAWHAIDDADAGRFLLVGKDMLNPETILRAPDSWIRLEDIIEAIEVEAPDVVMIDYLTKVQVADGRMLRSDLEKTERIVPALQRIAEKRRISMVWLSQMGRASKTAAKTGDAGGHGKGGGIIEETVDAEIELLRDVPETEHGQPPIVATVTKIGGECQGNHLTWITSVA